MSIKNINILTSELCQFTIVLNRNYKYNNKLVTYSLLLVQTSEAQNNSLHGRVVQWSGMTGHLLQREYISYVIAHLLCNSSKHPKPVKNVIIHNILQVAKYVAIIFTDPGKSITFIFQITDILY